MMGSGLIALVATLPPDALEPLIRSQDGSRRWLPCLPCPLAKTDRSARSNQGARRGLRPACRDLSRAVRPFCRSVVCSRASEPLRCRAVGFPRGSRLFRSVDLLLGYVDLHRRTQLAEMSECAWKWHRLREVPLERCAICLTISAKRRGEKYGRRGKRHTVPIR
jgi:hypothetical protein